jgi:hypothetical protein
MIYYKSFSDFLDNSLNAERFIVNTSNCKIPEFDAWDSTILSLIKAPQSRAKCTPYKWSSLESNVMSKWKLQYTLICKVPVTSDLSD